MQAVTSQTNRASSRTSLTDLANSILERATLIENYLNEQSEPLPSFDEHDPAELPLSPEMQKIRTEAVDASVKMHDLLVGPAMNLRPVLNATALQAIYKYNIAAKVPLDGSITFAALAIAVGLQEHDVRRIVRFAILHHRVFQEKMPGVVSHSGASRLLATSPDAMAALGFMFDEIYQSFAHTVEAFGRNVNPKPTQSGWALASRADVPMWTYHSTHPELGERAARAMSALTKGTTHDSSSLVKGYDWAPLNATKGTVIDLGGADGHASVSIARANPCINFVVQELPPVVAAAQYKVPADVSSQVKIIAHDFFTPQTAPADLVLVRQIFHNWSDEHCIEILCAIIPALKPGSKLLINDLVVPPPGVLPESQERQIRAMDMVMLSLFNSREREKGDWEALLARADERYKDVRIWKVEWSPLGFVEATWAG